MIIYNSISEFKNVKRPILTTGTFDGVHFGHRKIINRLKEIASEEEGETVLLTFSPHPRMVLFPDDHQLQLINTLDEKIELLKKAGIEHLIIHPFSKSFSRIKSMNFVRDIIVNQLNTHKLVIGYNHHFGRNREGSFEHLKEFAPLYGFEVEEIQAQLLDQISVSSTKIRHALINGEVAKANSFLGYDFQIEGQVVKGLEIGRTLHFPTANLVVNDSTKLIPKDGVYAVEVQIENQDYRGMMNIGFRPTLNQNIRTIEVHIFNFENNIYDQIISLKMKERLRDEMPFSSLEDLKKQLHKDKKMAMKILK